MRQPSFAALPCFLVHKGNLLEARMIVTTYNQHVRLLSSEPFGWFAPPKFTRAWEPTLFMESLRSEPLNGRYGVVSNSYEHLHSLRTNEACCFFLGNRDLTVSLDSPLDAQPVFSQQFERIVSSLKLKGHSTGQFFVLTIDRDLLLNRKIPSCLQSKMLHNCGKRLCILSDLRKYFVNVLRINSDAARTPALKITESQRAKFFDQTVSQTEI